MLMNAPPGHARPEGRFDNHPREYQHIKAVPFAAAMGAEIEGIDIASISDSEFNELEDALYRHKVVCLRDQHFSHADQEALTARFGPFSEDAFTAGVDGHPNVQPVIKEATQSLSMVFGGSWHTDSAFLDNPPGVSMLYSVESPPFGGDTWWANTALAYQFLTPMMQAMLQPLRVHMSGRAVVDGIRRKRAAGGEVNAIAENFDYEEMMHRGRYQPLIRRHPKTGEQSIYVDQTYAVGIEGLSKKESRALLDFLFNHITQPEFTCRLRWASNSLVLWDNRTTLHRAQNDYDGYRREAYRTIAAGEVPEA
ncbi:MAG: TauD/TfdA family dioxygenase [Pseudomonadota bacterium]